MPGGIRRIVASGQLQQAHALGLAMYSYANDNEQQYPDGNSSTEVFQKLLDGGYVSDPTLFYIPFPGKIKPVLGQKLKPENVCWDVTVGAASSDPGSVPLLFMTGYKVNYVPGGAAVPLIKPYPRFGVETHTWMQWLHPPELGPPGIAAFYVDNHSVYINVDPSSDSILNFISPDFKTNGKTYRQLTPDGTLP